MFENLYTTKMSMDKKKLQNRFTKIRSRSGRISKITALIVFAALILVMLCVSIIIATNVNIEDYSMTESEFLDFVNRPIGAVMADIDYTDGEKVVFHYGKGLFIIHRQDTMATQGLSSEIDFAINLEKLNIAYNQQGSCVLDVKISKDGQFAYLSTIGPEDEIKKFEKYIISLDNGAVRKGSMPKNAELFSGKADTFQMVQNPSGFFSNGCVVNDDKIYYLTSALGTVRDIQLVAVNNSNNQKSLRYVFSRDVSDDTQQIKFFASEDIKDIIDVELVIGGIKYPPAVTDAAKKIEKAFSTATEIKMGGTACPFDAELIFTRKDGEKGSVTIATDSCAVFKSGDTYYDYGEDNSMLLGYFGLDVNTVIDLTTINKSYMDNSEIAVRNFFKAFGKSDIETMKTLVTNDFITQGYIGDYNMCYGMTRATLETCSGANPKEFLTNYLAKPENEQLELSENDIELLKRFSDKMAVYTVVVTAESNIKGETNPPFKRFLNVVCKKQKDGGWLVHKLV